MKAKLRSSKEHYAPWGKLGVAAAIYALWYKNLSENAWGGNRSLSDSGKIMRHANFRGPLKRIACSYLVFFSKLLATKAAGLFSILAWKSLGNLSPFLFFFLYRYPNSIIRLIPFQYFLGERKGAATYFSSLLILPVLLGLR